MKPTLYILRDKEPVPVEDILEWGIWFEREENRRVAFDEFEGGVQVSTVFLGINHSFRDGPPILFETLVFGGEHDGEMERYSTWDEAEAGHARMLELVRKAEAWPDIIGEELS